MVPGRVSTRHDAFDESNLLLMEATPSGIVARSLKARLEQTQSRSMVLLPLCTPGERRNVSSSLAAADDDDDGYEPTPAVSYEPAPAASEPAGWGAVSEAAVVAPVAQVAAPAAVATTPAGWYPDPSGRFEMRYWDGTAWTEHVSRQGQQYTDPPVA